MKQKLRELKSYPLLIFFAAFITVFFITDIFVTGKEFSETENRYLKQNPPFTLKALMANEYTKEYEEFINDQFAFRDQWISLKSVGEMALGKIENNGVAYGREGYLFPKLFEASVAETRQNGAGFGGDGGEETALPVVNQGQIDANVKFLNRFLAAYPGHVTISIVPNAYQILPDLLPKGLENADQSKAIAQVYGRLEGAALDTLDLEGPLTESSQERQTYYRTDHHWTTDGAWAAYAAYAQSRGLEAVSLETLAPYRREVPDFLGTNYSKTKNIDVQPDTLVWYDLPVGTVTIDGKTTVMTSQKEEIPVEGLYRKEMLAQRDKYAAFLYGNNGLTVIPSENNLNHQEGKTSRVLLIKDSYGNCLAPFLTYSYDEVYVVDLRSLPMKLSDLVSQTQFDDIWILYNFTSFQQDKDLARITF